VALKATAVPQQPKINLLFTLHLLLSACSAYAFLPLLESPQAFVRLVLGIFSDHKLAGNFEFS
jgi:hypothetical protein